MYYLVIIQNDSAQAIYAYNSMDDALAQFHSELAYRAEARTSTVCVILDANGALVKRDVWRKEVPEPEPEPEESES